MTPRDEYQDALNRHTLALEAKMVALADSELQRAVVARTEATLERERERAAALFNVLVDKERAVSAALAAIPPEPPDIEREGESND